MKLCLISQDEYDLQGTEGEQDHDLHGIYTGLISLKFIASLEVFLIHMHTKGHVQKLKEMDPINFEKDTRATATLSASFKRPISSHSFSCPHYFSSLLLLSNIHRMSLSLQKNSVSLSSI
ncbi:hypothetical protein QVD17_23241 [Tagetes erecta]|uniref:Uncharacterized protein n=1 Tax=Tagetes erecta TaxID=13708 RepID=A0AAD8NU63_TARER|nr:hypothetical protein QVD17_23241 [Tagetes erecta]